MNNIDFTEIGRAELLEAGWLESESSPKTLYMIKVSEEVVALEFYGGNLYGILVKDLDCNEVLVDQFITFEMACDFARAF